MLIQRILFFTKLLASGLALVALTPVTLRAADATWNVNADGNWVDDSNWNPAAAPGSTSSTTNTDTATFGTVISSAHAITVDANRNIFGINFAGNSSAYTLSGGNLLLTAGGTIQTSGGGSGHTDNVNSAITLEGDYTFTGGSSTATRILSIGGTVTSAATSGTTTLTLNGANTGNNTVGGVISNGGGTNVVAVSKSGAGNWVLSNANTYSGGTTLSAGTLVIGNNSAFGTGALTLNGGSLKAATTSNWALGNNISVGGSTQIDLNSKNVDLNGNLSGSGAVSVAHTGSTASTLTLGGDNSGYSGTLTASNLGNGNAVNFTSATAGSASAAWVFNDANVDRVRIAFGNGTINFGSIAGAGQIQNDTLATTSTISVGALNTSTTFSGTMKNNSTGILALTKVGTGTLTLTGTTSNYTGTTTVSNGELRIANTTGSATGAGAVALSGGSTTTLSGTGFSTGALTVTNGSRIAPGSNVSGPNSNFGAAGTLSLGTTGGMTLTNANFDFDLANTATVGAGVNDLIATGGALSLASTEAFTFNELSGTLLTGTAYTLISGATSANTGVDTTGWTTSFVNGPSYIPTFGFSGNNLQVTFNVVPEPSTWVMLLGGFGILVGYQRSRRRA